jgi:hypothetical protein
MASSGDTHPVRLRQGRLAQLVEHLVYTERVGGSSPSPPTNSRRFGRTLAALVVGMSVTFPVVARADRGPMTFAIAELGGPECGAKCPKVVVAEGVIEEQTADQFLEFAHRAALADGLRAVVLIDSPGGNVVASMELGAAFRQLRLSAIVAGFAQSGGQLGPTAGQCVSACVYALMGAVRRVVPPASRIALHRMSIEMADGGARRFADSRLVGVVARYAQRMGVNPRIVWAAESMAPDHVRVLTPRELRGWGLATSRF